VRFPGLWNRARAWGCEAFATGHYARVARESGEARVARPVDRARDQSYMLWGIPPETLEHAIFPLGELAKSEVRRLARDASLDTAERPDSQEICFVPDGDYAAVVAARAEAAALRADTLQDGEIVTRDGTVIGRHRGAARFTIGQRRGIGVATARPLYVLALDAETNRVVVGPEEDLLARTAVLRTVRWPRDCERMDLLAHVQIRSRAAAAPARIARIGEHGARVTFESAQRAITPGQSAVFYDRDVVVGGGVVESVGA
jgi:tRNA-specific 2-thiouridylase